MIEVLKGAAIVVGISALYHKLAHLSAALTGAGHGTAYFFQAILSPLSLINTELFELASIIFWPLVAVLLAFRRLTFCRYFVVAALVLHYVGILIVSFRTDWYYIGKVWHTLPLLVTELLGAYFASQIFVWSLIIPPKKAIQTPVN
ncbi:MAG: hypothetical protein HY043_06735 [Verrucomicrobia bacterium]|nr:hypothetical protein [Verrucomicrobiota bacterium]